MCIAARHSLEGGVGRTKALVKVTAELVRQGRFASSTAPNCPKVRASGMLASGRREGSRTRAVHTLSDSPCTHFLPPSLQRLDRLQPEHLVRHVPRSPVKCWPPPHVHQSVLHPHFVRSPARPPLGRPSCELPSVSALRCGARPAEPAPTAAGLSASGILSMIGRTSIHGTHCGCSDATNSRHVVAAFQGQAIR